MMKPVIFSIKQYLSIQKDIQKELDKKTFDLSQESDISYLAFVYCRKILKTSEEWYFNQTKVFLKNTSIKFLCDGLTSLVFRLSKHVSWEAWNRVYPLKKVPIHITSVEKTLTQNVAYTLDITILNSTVQPIHTKLVVTGAYCNYLLYIGGALRAEEYIPQDVSGMYFLATIQNKPGLYLHVCDWGTVNNMFNFNRKLLKARKSDCISGFKKGVCIDCPLSSNVCKLSRHTQVYKEGKCRLGNHIGYIVKDNLCKYCLDKHKYKIRGTSNGNRT